MHANLNAASRGMMGPAEFGLMKRTVQTMLWSKYTCAVYVHERALMHAQTCADACVFTSLQTCAQAFFINMSRGGLVQEQWPSS